MKDGDFGPHFPKHPSFGLHQGVFFFFQFSEVDGYIGEQEDFNQIWLQVRENITKILATFWQNAGNYCLNMAISFIYFYSLEKYVLAMTKI